MRITIPLLVVFAILAAGCGKEAPPTPAPAPEKPTVVAPTEPQAITTGTVSLRGMPGNVESVLEVISIDPIPDNVVELITRQQSALEDYLNPPNSSMKQASNVVSEEDHEKITKMIDALRQKYPPPLESEFYNDSGQPEMFTSRESLYKRYIPLFKAVSVETMVPSINEISQQMRTDHTMLEKLAEDRSKDGLQARADINWLAALSKYFQQYQSVISTYDQARHRQAARYGGQTEVAQSPILRWKYFQQETAPDIEIAIYKSAAQTVYAEDDGSFEVQGHGKLIVRATLEGNSVFFIQDGPGGKHLQFSNVAQTMVDPSNHADHQPE